ncbi:hypothetical protein AVEN_133740-1 [Araneus ventricosus]|uniref:Uncharacterized protein n=1 Tax=Araneus ventricosus TaxID=182803 RepID=A0A4Y2B7Q5_ARAVE|nr:hypothetical protein AVEN_133740-1 [Araneus ventricosus]
MKLASPAEVRRTNTLQCKHSEVTWYIPLLRLYAAITSLRFFLALPNHPGTFCAYDTTYSYMLTIQLTPMCLRYNLLLCAYDTAYSYVLTIQLTPMCCNVTTDGSC